MNRLQRYHSDILRIVQCCRSINMTVTNSDESAISLINSGDTQVSKAGNSSLAHITPTTRMLIGDAWLYEVSVFELTGSLCNQTQIHLSI